jgi:molecular chaperone GrpE
MSDDKAKDVPNVPKNDNKDEMNVKNQTAQPKTEPVTNTDEKPQAEATKRAQKTRKWAKKDKVEQAQASEGNANTNEQNEALAADTSVADERVALEARVAELEDELLRQRAETENFKRRTKKEYETNLTYANQRLIEQFLPVLDAFDRALSTQDANDEATKQFLKGFEMTDALLKQTLEQAGLSPIPSVGEKFDPYLHQAVMQESDPTKDEDEILEELQKGYKLKDRVIRASMVKTNKK